VRARTRMWNGNNGINEPDGQRVVCERDHVELKDSFHLQLRPQAGSHEQVGKSRRRRKRRTVSHF
jgi:hypothetical protein